MQKVPERALCPELELTRSVKAVIIAAGIGVTFMLTIVSASVTRQYLAHLKGRVLEAHLNTGRVRYLRAGLHSALGRPWEDARPALRPVYEKLVRLGQAETDNARFLAKSQEARPGAERWRSFAYARAAAERRQTSAPGMARAARKRGGWFCVCRRSASPL